MHDENKGIYIGKSKIIELTINENKILYLLIKNKGRVVTFDEFSEILLYGENADIYIKNCIRQKIFKLRNKLKGEVEIYGRKGWGYYIE